VLCLDYGYITSVRWGMLRRQLKIGCTMLDCEQENSSDICDDLM
jgi:hypothetical protein